jgi:hypothetical protein
VRRHARLAASASRGRRDEPRDRARHALDRASIEFWQQYTERARTVMPHNAFSPPSTPPGGAPTIGYGGGFFALGPDDALLIESDVPDADYWGWTLHTMRWLESGNFAERQTSLNHAQAHVDGDGRLRIVAARRDPGIPNWIDVEDRRRAFSSTATSARVEAGARRTRRRDRCVRDHLPKGHPIVDAAARREHSPAVVSPC